MACHSTGRKGGVPSKRQVAKEIHIYYNCEEDSLIRDKCHDKQRAILYSWTKSGGIHPFLVDT